MSGPTTLKRDLAYAAIAVAALAATSMLGQIATYPNLAPWYASLAKPSFNPPNWVFAPVWTAIYALMAFALWRVLRAGTSSRRRALLWFATVLALNASWSWMFFAAQSPLLGMINIVPQLTAIVATIVVTARVDRLAAAALLPLAIWVAFATALNAAIWRLNG